MQCAAVRSHTVWAAPRRRTPRVGQGSQIQIRAEGQQPLELPGGAFWWLGSHKKSSAVIYGDNFLIQRTRVGGEGLVPAAKDVAVTPYAPRRSSPPAVSPRRPTGLTLASTMVVIDTEFEVVSDSPAAAAPPTSCTGIVYLGPADGQTPLAQDAGAARGRHPRRTRRLRFTCNLCGETNEKAVNPRAWRTGSVFARCEGCTAVHKLKDNLKIFHELGGPVFPPKDLRGSFPAVKEIIDRIQERRRRDLGPAAEP